jgi:hypothetical protein
MLKNIIWGIIVLLVIFWIIGLVVKVAFWGIHLLLVLAVILLIYNLVVAGRSRAL